MILSGVFQRGDRSGSELSSLLDENLFPEMMRESCWYEKFVVLHCVELETIREKVLCPPLDRDVRRSILESCELALRPFGGHSFPSRLRSPQELMGLLLPVSASAWSMVTTPLRDRVWEVARSLVFGTCPEVAGSVLTGNIVSFLLMD